MSKNINQVYMTNPITSNASTDLMYFGQSPYGVGNDAAMTYANFAAQFGAPFTPAALTEVNDTNVTLTLGGTPATALLHAVSITAGWTGTLSPTRGGTGVANASGSTITLGGSLTTSGAFASTFTMTAPTSVTFPTSGTLATTSQIPTGAALTEVNDTNVTLTLGGSPSTALVNAASITAGWAGQLSPSRGGTGINNGALTINLGSATTGYLLTSDSSGNATWQAPGYLTGAVLLSPSGNQTIVSNNLSLSSGAFTASGTIQSTAGNLIAGTNGTAGTLRSFAAGSNLGTFSLTAVNSSGNFAAVLSNASLGQATTWSLPDPGASTATVAVNTGALTTGHLVSYNGTSGLVQDSGIPASNLLNPNVTFTGTFNGPAIWSFYPATTYVNGVSSGSGITMVIPVMNASQNSLLTLNLGNVTEVNGSLFNFNSTSITSFVANSLRTFDVSFTPNWSALTTLTLPSLTSTGGDLTFTAASLTTYSLPDLVYVGGSFSGTLASATTISIPNLVTITSAFGATWNAVTSLSLPALTTIGNIAATFNSVTSLSFPVLTTTATFSLSSTSLTTFSLPAFLTQTSGNFTLTMPSLTTFSFNSGLLKISGNVTITNAALTQASVDGILVSLANLNGTGGTTSYNNLTVNLSGGSSSTPSSTGLAAKATLVGRGCTVTTN
jgi:hypothetical protein